MGLALFTLLGAPGCQEPGQPAAPAGTAASTLPSRPLAVPRGVLERRSFARKLAQRAASGFDETLMQLLRDEDPDTLAWAAFGLGESCRGRETPGVQALVVRATSLALSPAKADHFAPEQALALALSRCATREAERSLVAWLNRPQAISDFAALGLARLAHRQRNLEDGSLVGLLDAASRPTQPVHAALLAFERLTGLSPSAATRVRDVAKGVLKAPAESRAYVLGALLHADSEADSLLGSAVTDPSFTLGERATAVRILSQRGAGGRTALAQALVKLSEGFPSAKPATGAPWPVLLAALRVLPVDYPQNLKAVLQRWATTPLPEHGPAFLRHRVVQARCLAAALVAGKDSLAPPLLACAPKGELEGELAQVEVLDRAPIEAARLTQWRKLLDSPRPRVRQAALRLLAGHRELEAKPALSKALEDAHPGTVAAAALLLAAHPDRVQREHEDSQISTVDEAVVAALTRAFERQYASDQIAVRGTLSEAAAALQLLNLKSRIEQLCREPSPTLRNKAQKSLVLLGDRNAQCPPPATKAEAVSDRPALDKPIVLVFEIAGAEHTLTLRPDWAPHSVQRVLDLVGEGFYNGMAIHRAAPGQVVQFGDPVGDGHGGSGRAPIVSEPSPQHFGAFTVGMADWGRDTASSQLFVTLSAAPNLDGEYTWIGSASPTWDQVILDDVIERVRVQ